MLLGIGFGTPAFARREAADDRSNEDRAAEQRQNIERVRSMVELLEERIAILQLRLTEERRRTDKLRAELEEPYVG